MSLQDEMSDTGEERNPLGCNAETDDSLDHLETKEEAERIDLSDFFSKEDSEASIKKHLTQLLSFEEDNLHVASVACELEGYGVMHDITLRASRNKIKRSSKDAQIKRLTKAELKTGVVVVIPKFLHLCCKFLSMYKCSKGIFRKTGSLHRINDILSRSLYLKTEDTVETFFKPCHTEHDVSSALKKFLSRMTAPIIPPEFSDTLLQCLNLDCERAQVESLLLSVCLLPVSNVHTLSYLMEFLFEVSLQNDSNMMGADNLSVVITPNIISSPPSHNSNKMELSAVLEKQKLSMQCQVIELMIRYGDLVGYVGGKLLKRLELAIMSAHDDGEQECCKRKKRRSGSLSNTVSHGVFGFLKKVAGNPKAYETPSSAVKLNSERFQDTTPQTFSHTPVIKRVCRSVQKNLDERARKRKKTRKGSLSRSDFEPSTPDILFDDPHYYATTGICLDPSPARNFYHAQKAYKERDAYKIKNLITPSLPRSRKKTKDKATTPAEKVIAPSSAPAVKKDQNQKRRKTASLNRQESIMSIHSLVSSPRKSVTLSRKPSSKIPLARMQPPQSTLSGRSRIKIQPPDDLVPGSTKNRISCLSNCSSSDEAAVDSGQNVQKDTYSFSEGAEIDSTKETKDQFCQYVKEIANLAEMTEKVQLQSTSPKLFEKYLQSDGIDESESELSKDVLEKYQKAKNESKLIELKSERDIRSRPTLTRHLSLNDKRSTASPSQRRILSMRRKSDRVRKHPSIKVLDLSNNHSIKTQSKKTPEAKNCSSQIESPSKCTLKRGRPNSERSGLNRPTPVKNDSCKKIFLDKSPNAAKVAKKASYQVCTSPGAKFHSEDIDMAENHAVEILGKENLTPLTAQNEIPSTPKLTRVKCVKTVNSDDKGVEEDWMKKTPIPCSRDVDWSAKKRRYRTPRSSNYHRAMERTYTPRHQNVSFRECAWTPGNKFDFTQDSNSESGSSRRDRESISALKNNHAGKVLANIQYFNGISKKSPKKSNIPRYVSKR